MKRELLFFERDSFYTYKELKYNEGYTITSISDFIRDITNDELFANFDHNSQIIDITSLALGYQRITMGW